MEQVEVAHATLKGGTLAKTAWASATACQLDVQLFIPLARVPPFSVAWATSTCSKGACPSRFGHIFQSLCKIGCQWILDPVLEGLGALNLHFFAKFSL